MENSKILLGNKYYYMEMVSELFCIKEVTITGVVNVETLTEGIVTKIQRFTDEDGKYIQVKNLFKSRKDCINYYKKELVKLLKDERANN